MPTINNVSQNIPLSALILAAASRQNPESNPALFTINGGSSSIQNPSGPGGLIDYKHRYFVNLLNSDHIFSWTGRLLPGDIVDVDPEAKTVKWKESGITLEHLNIAKSAGFFDGIDESDRLSLDQILDLAKSRDPHGHLVSTDNNMIRRNPPRIGNWSECDVAIARVVFDVAVTAFHLPGFYKKITQNDKEMVDNFIIGRFQQDMNRWEMIRTVVNQLVQMVRRGNYSDVGGLAVKLLYAIKDDIISIMRLIFSCLSVGDIMLYSALIAAEVMTTVALLVETEGVASVLLVDLEYVAIAANIGIFIKDGVDAAEKCFDTVSDFKVGDRYKGGIIFYIDNTGQHGLIAAPEDQSSSIHWGNTLVVEYGSKVTEEAIGTGLSNTNLIVTSQGAGSYAAKLCDDLVLNGFDDWYLPSKVELNEMYKNRTVIGGFSNGNYWSSSAMTSQYSWFQNFNNGDAYYSGNDYTYYVRAIRAF